MIKIKRKEPLYGVSFTPVFLIDIAMHRFPLCFNQRTGWFVDFSYFSYTDFFMVTADASDVASLSSELHAKVFNACDNI